MSIIGVSGNSGKQHEHKCMVSGMDYFLVKPVSKTLLFDTVAEYIKKSN